MFILFLSTAMRFVPHRVRPLLGTLAEKDRSNICFGKIEVRIIIVPMDAIEIGNARTAAGAVGDARPGAYAGFGGGLRAGRGAAKAFSAGVGDNPLKSHKLRKKVDLDFVPKNLDFVQSGLDFLQPGLGIPSVWLGNPSCPWARASAFLSPPAPSQEQSRQVHDAIRVSVSRPVHRRSIAGFSTRR